MKLSGSGLWSQGSIKKDTQEKNTKIQAQCCASQAKKIGPGVLKLFSSTLKPCFFALSSLKNNN